MTKPKRKQIPNKPLLLSGMALFIAWLPLVAFSESIAGLLPYREYTLLGTVVSEPNTVPIFVTLLLTPPILGLILILLSVSNKAR